MCGRRRRDRRRTPRGAGEGRAAVRLARRTARHPHPRREVPAQGLPGPLVLPARRDLLYSFVVLILTGVWLTLFFHPSMNEVTYHGSYTPLNGVRMSEAY